MASATFPILIKRGSATVKIYRTPMRGRDMFTLSYYLAGSRKRSVFADLAEAKSEAATVATNLTAGDLEVSKLSTADAAAYRRATELLAPTGVPLESAVAQFVDAVQRLRTVPLGRVVDSYLHRHPVELTPRKVAEVVEEMLRQKRQDRVSEAYLKQLRFNLERVAKQFPVEIGQLHGAAVDEWLRGLGWSPRTRNNLRNALQTLFNFAKARKYLPRDHEELEAVAVAKDGDGEIEIFTPSELAEILSAAGPRMVPFVALGAFAGVRHAEIQRLEWEDIRFEDGIVEIRAAKAKTASRRLVPIMDALRAWLLPLREESGLVCTYQNVSNAIQGIEAEVNRRRREAGRDSAFAWKKNALRHSFISYRVAQIQNVAQVALEAGNSPQMIFKHYRELVRPADAEKWFAIRVKEPASRDGS